MPADQVSISASDVPEYATENVVSFYIEHEKQWRQFFIEKSKV